MGPKTRAELFEVKAHMESLLDSMSDHDFVMQTGCTKDGYRNCPGIFIITEPTAARYFTYQELLDALPE